MIPVVVAALALMGAPTNTQVMCDPALEDTTGNAGVTYMTETPRRIVLGRTACAGILLASMTQRERVLTQDLNPAAGVWGLEGDGLLILLHEAHHASGDWNETNTECAAMAALPSFLRQFGFSESQLIEAQDFDLALPDTYHEHAC